MDLSTLMPQQLQIVKTLDRPLFVSAGAGSGKTFTLTRRIVYALSPESGPFVEHLDRYSPSPLPKMPRPRSATACAVRLSTRVWTRKH